MGQWCDPTLELRQYQHRNILSCACSDLAQRSNVAELVEARGIGLHRPNARHSRLTSMPERGRNRMLYLVLAARCVG